jgi:hypothetical protein
MRVRFIALLILPVIIATILAVTADARSGRWKSDGAGGCYWDANDDGPNQCDPNAPSGRWKIGDDGSCYWDSADSGPNQCDGTLDEQGFTESQLIDYENTVLQIQADGGFGGDAAAAEIVLRDAVAAGWLSPDLNPVVADDPPIPCDWKPVLIDAIREKIRGLERQRRIAQIAAAAEIRFSRSLAFMFGVFITEASSEINALHWKIQQIIDAPCF